MTNILCEDSDNAVEEDLRKHGCSCENCYYHNGTDLRCKHPENPDPKETAHPTDLCIGWERR